MENALILVPLFSSVTFVAGLIFRFAIIKMVVKHAKERGDRIARIKFFGFEILIDV